MESVRRDARHEARVPALGALVVIAPDPASLDATHHHVDVPAIEEALRDAAGAEHLARVLVKEAEDARRHHLRERLGAVHFSNDEAIHLPRRETDEASKVGRL